MKKPSFVNSDLTNLDRKRAIELARQELRETMEAQPLTAADQIRAMFARRVIRELEKKP